MSSHTYRYLSWHFQNDLTIFDLLSSQDSNVMHQARLKVLQNREQFIEELLADTRKRLYAATKDVSTYRNTLGGLITQVRIESCCANLINHRSRLCDSREPPGLFINGILTVLFFFNSRVFFNLLNPRLR